MDFATALRRTADFLDREGHRFALIGGHALAAYGSGRATIDLDLAVDRAAQETLVQYLESLGYQTLHRSCGYSNHLHRNPDYGRIDFVYVAGETADQLFGSAVQLPGPDQRRVAVLRPEHLAAMKVVAMKNEPARTHRELADIRFLLSLPVTDHEEVKRYFAKHGMESLFDELEETY